MGERESKKQWDAENTERVSLKLNKNTDADILEAIDKAPKQTEIKRLIREGMKKAHEMTKEDSMRVFGELSDRDKVLYVDMIRMYRGFDSVDRAAILAFATAIQNGSSTEEARKIANDIRRSNGKQIDESEEWT